VPDTSRGYTYPDSTGHTRLWEHFEELADDIDTDLAAVFALLPVRMAAGSVVVTLTAVAFNSSAIVFPVGRFTVAPLVVCSLGNAPGGTQKFVPRTINQTTSGADVWVYTGDQTSQTGTCVVSWIAIQMTAGAAAG
jgi:hypothetical protein